MPTGLNSEEFSAFHIQVFQGSSETHDEYAYLYQVLLLRILVSYKAR